MAILGVQKSPLYEISSSATCLKHGVTVCNLGFIMTGREWTWASGAEHTSLTAKSDIQKLANHLITVVTEKLLMDHKKTLQLTHSFRMMVLDMLGCMNLHICTLHSIIQTKDKTKGQMLFEW